MRRRLQRYLPIVLIALAMQLLAPVAACWAAALAAADPLQNAPICHDVTGATGQADQDGGVPAHAGGCALCCIAQNGASPAPASIGLSTPEQAASLAQWHRPAEPWFGSRIGSNTQARAPPRLS